MDFIHLNKACPKDSHPLPNINRVMDRASRYRYLSFMDTYSGYNQIWMHPDDEEKTTFITKDANYYYRVMSFQLKNIGATYQQLMNKVFADEIGQNIEVYFDDMVAKTSKNKDHCSDLAEIFEQI